jgi:hypothetical protein
MMILIRKSILLMKMVPELRKLILAGMIPVPVVVAKSIKNVVDID